MDMVDSAKEAESRDVPKPNLTEKKARPKTPYTIEGTLFMVPASDFKNIEILLGANSLRNIVPIRPTGTDMAKTKPISINEPMSIGNIPPSLIARCGHAVKKPGLKKYGTPETTILTSTNNITTKTP
jgi:hypothetical protein